MNQRFPVTGETVYEGKLFPDLLQALVGQLLVWDKEVFKQFLDLLLDPHWQCVDLQPDLGKLLQGAGKVVLHALKTGLDILQLIPQGAGNLRPYGFQAIPNAGS